MKVLVVFLAVIGSIFAASLDKYGRPNGLAALLAEQRGHGLIGTRIVGGTPTPIEQVPYIVTMQRFSAHRCGGSIISESRVLTAAHCMYDWNGATFIPVPAAQLSVRAGSTLSQAAAGQLIQCERYVNHPAYDDWTLNNDISIMHLVSAFNFAPAGVAIIALPPQSAGVAAGAMARVSGWGAISENGPGSPTLLAVDVPVITNAQCYAAYGGDIFDGMICAGFPEGGRDACQGDSGGPLTFGNQLIGVVSWGIGCARPGYPGVYARTAHYRNWIDAN